MKTILALVAALTLSTGAFAEPKVYPTSMSDCTSDAEYMKIFVTSRNSGVDRKVLKKRVVANFNAGTVEVWEMNFIHKLIDLAYDSGVSAAAMEADYLGWCKKQLKENLQARATM